MDNPELYQYGLYVAGIIAVVGGVTAYGAIKISNFINRYRKTKIPEIPGETQEEHNSRVIALYHKGKLGIIDTPEPTSRPHVKTATRAPPAPHKVNGQNTQGDISTEL